MNDALDPLGMRPGGAIMNNALDHLDSCDQEVPS